MQNIFHEEISDVGEGISKYIIPNKIKRRQTRNALFCFIFLCISASRTVAHLGKFSVNLKTDD